MQKFIPSRDTRCNICPMKTKCRAENCKGNCKSCKNRCCYCDADCKTCSVEKCYNRREDYNPTIA